MKTRDMMTRSEFAAEYANAYPKDGMNAEFDANPAELAAWRDAVVNHYFDGESHREPFERMKVRRVLESAFAAAVRAARQVRRAVMVAA